ncbi:MAG: CDGSH iron-sulfur domain-containing protein [Patescibacteria group bacterium]
MARLVKKTAQGPLELKPQDKSVWICMCGLSRNQPFCDDSHQKTLDEDPSKTYSYDESDNKQEVA